MSSFVKFGSNIYQQKEPCPVRCRDDLRRIGAGFSVFCVGIVRF